MCDSVCLRFFFFFCVLQHVSVSRRGAPLQPKRLTYPQADPRTLSARARLHVAGERGSSCAVM